MSFLKKLAVLAGVAALASPAFAENCAATTFTALAASDCAGSFGGNINGSIGEVTFLNAEFGNTFTFVGKSDGANNGPFTSNPEVNANGVLTFDAAISGTFVIGLKAANQYSYYLFNAVNPISSLTFNSTAGVSTNQRGIAQDLSHAVLYTTVTAPVPEPETYALMLAGLGVIGFVARRRKR